MGACVPCTNEGVGELEAGRYWAWEEGADERGVLCVRVWRHETAFTCSGNQIWGCRHRAERKNHYDPMGPALSSMQ